MRYKTSHILCRGQISRCHPLLLPVFSQPCPTTRSWRTFTKIFSAPAKRQSTNGLVESHWKVMVHMARAYLTEKQMPRSYWFFAITHAARMMNAIPGKVDGGLASPFLLVHGVGHEPVFSQPCPTTRSWRTFTTLVLLSRRSARVTRLTPRTRRLTGLARKSIASWDVGSSATTNTSCM